MLQIKRVYAPVAPDDGFRVLVDRLWPRGLTKQAAAVDLWLKEVAPSHELRRWFNHDAPRWPEFERRYRAELADPARAAALQRLRDLAGEHDRLTLLFGAKEKTRNHAALLRDLLSG